MSNHMESAIINATSGAKVAIARHLLQLAGAGFFSVTFVKKDGTLRRVVGHLPSAASHVVGDAASASAKQAVATRRARHPNLLSVWDVHARGYRSINLATVQKVVINKTAFVFI